MNRIELISALGNLDGAYPAELADRDRFLTLLEHPRAYHRDHLPGHITGSAWIVNQDFSKVLLVLHAKLGRWLQPGGHADGDEMVDSVALREAREETGVIELSFVTPTVFDIDIHPIPQRKDFPSHDHYDIRFLLQASDQQKLEISDESNDLRWFSLDEVPRLVGHSTSIIRMVEKTRDRFH